MLGPRLGQPKVLDGQFCDCDVEYTSITEYHARTRVGAYTVRSHLVGVCQVTDRSIPCNHLNGSLPPQLVHSLLTVGDLSVLKGEGPCTLPLLVRSLNFP